MRHVVALLGLLLLLGARAAAAAPVDLKDLPSGTPAHALWRAAVLPRDWTIDDVHSPRAQPVDWLPAPRAPVALNPAEALWLKLELEPNGALAPPRWMIEFPRPGLDRVDMFRFEADDLTLNEVAGDELPVAGWPLGGRYPAFEVAGTRWQPVTYYFRVRHSHAFSLTGYLKTPTHYLRTQLLASLFFGIFFGAIGLMLVLAVQAAATTRRMAYAAFAVYAFATALACLAASGLLGEWWVDAAPRAADIAPFVLAVAAAALAPLHLAAAVSLFELSRRRFAATLAFTGVGLAMGAAAPWLPLPPHGLALGSGCAAFALCAALLGLAWFKGERSARGHLASLLPYGLALSYPLAESLLGVRNPPETFFLVAAAALAHLALSYAALNARITRQLETQARLQASNTVDPLTGVANYRRLSIQMPGLLERARYHRHHGALLLVQIANLHDFRRDGGQRAMELAVVRTAAALRDCVKNIDLVSRVGDASFAVAVEGPVSHEQVASLATQLIAQGLRVSADRPHQTPLSLRVFVELVPQAGRDLDELLARASQQLRAVPPNDPRRIFLGGMQDATPKA